MNKAAPRKESSPQSSQADINTNISAAAQRARLLDALIEASVTTYEAREFLNIVMPAARVKELRDQGHDIFTSYETLPDSLGRLHPRSARYVLLGLAKEVRP